MHIFKTYLLYCNSVGAKGKDFDMKMRATVTVAVSALLSVALLYRTADGETTLSAGRAPGTLDKSLANEVNAAIDRSLDWLAANQKEDGSWSNGNFPALTALPAWAFVRGTHPKKKEVVAKAVGYLMSCVRDNGGIYREVKGRQGGGLGNYNTAIAMTTLHATGDPALVPTVLKARKFIARGQHFGDDVYEGGFGYNQSTDRPYADLQNTLYAAEAMRLTQGVEDLRDSSEDRVDIDWSKTVKFIEKMQNKPEAGPDQEGGFIYRPGESRAGTTTNKEGVVVFRSYASMTYAGLLALIYADVNRNDTRVRSAFKWASERWSLEENPGMGMQGMFFFFNVLTRSLHAYGADIIPLDGGKTVDWRRELAKRLISLQTIDPATGHGFWRNDTGRFWEKDPVLVTAYSILALEHVIGQ